MKSSAAVEPAWNGLLRRHALVTVLADVHLTHRLVGRGGVTDADVVAAGIGKPEFAQSPRHVCDRGDRQLRRYESGVPRVRIVGDDVAPGVVHAGVETLDGMSQARNDDPPPPIARIVTFSETRRAKTARVPVRTGRNRESPRASRRARLTGRRLLRSLAVVPEGDSLHNLATRLRPALAGAKLRSLRVPEASGPPPAIGSQIVTVEARGKFLRIGFTGGIELQTHLQMNGRWLLQRADAPRQFSDHLARVILETDEHLAVCLRAPVVRLVRISATSVSDDVPASLAHLGPDLCRRDADLSAAVARLRTHASPGAEVANVLLDQRVMAGIGNVYKSEVVFACAVDPFRALVTINEATRERIVRTAARQLRANLRPGRRATVPGGLAVYGRERQPCLRCTTLIEARRQGPDARVTYWCPRCQR